MSRLHVGDRSMVTPEPAPSGTINTIRYTAAFTVEGCLPESVVEELRNLAALSLWGEHYCDADVDNHMEENAGAAIERAIKDRLLDETDPAITAARLTQYDLTTE